MPSASRLVGRNWLAPRLALALATMVVLAPRPSSALGLYRDRLPSHVECLTCHTRPDGGGAPACSGDQCLNPFGEAFERNGHLWSAALALRDHDGDGYTSGQELGDWDGVGGLDPSHEPMRTSPGHQDTDGNECFLGTALCPEDAAFCEINEEGTRPFFECVHHGPHNLPTPLQDGVWQTVDTTREVVSTASSACTDLGVAKWFSYRMDCGGAGASATIEVRGNSSISVYDPRDMEALEPHRELDCPGVYDSTDRMRRLRITRSALIRVVDGGPLLTEIRATCTPGTPSPLPPGTLHQDDHPTCAHAAEVTDGMTPYRTVGDRVTALGSGPLSDPLLLCPSSGPESDLWVRYRATCDGRMVARIEPSSFGHPASLAAFPGQECPLPETLLGCAHRPYPETDPAEVNLSVARGDEILLRLSSDFSDAPLEIACIPSPETCNACAPDATCASEDGPPTCTCPPGFEGDARLPSRGGTGCEPSQCVHSNLECEPYGRCTLRGDNAIGCSCQPGTMPRFQTCVDVENCYSGACPGLHTRCYETEPGFVCGCEPGYSPDRNSEEFRCTNVCGDGFRNPLEDCDDGNLEDGDGCNSECEAEFNFACREQFGLTSTCENTCGNGFIDEGEFCPRDAGLCSVSLPGGTRKGSSAWLLLLLPLTIWGWRRRSVVASAQGKESP